MPKAWKIINDAQFTTVQDLTRINSVENLASEEPVPEFSRQSAFEQLLQVRMQLIKIMALPPCNESLRLIKLTLCVVGLVRNPWRRTVW